MSVEPRVREDRRVVGCYRAERAGPTLVCVGAVHGNEPAGVEAARRVLAILRARRPASFRGELCALIGHTRAHDDPDDSVRYYESDLNRAFTPARIAAWRAGRDAEAPEAEQALGLLAAFEDALARSRGRAFCVDLHTVSSESPPFAAMEDALAVRRFMRPFGLPVILGFEEELRGLLADYLTNEYSVVTAIFEGGQHDDPGAVDLHEAVIWTALSSAGLVDLREVGLSEDPRGVLRRAAGPYAGRVFDVRHRQEIAAEDFRVVDAAHAFFPVHQGRTLVAREAGVDIIAPTTGLLFMPNRQRRRRVGDDGFFVVHEVGRSWLRLSARLRRRPWVHRWLRHHAPGVAPHPTDLDTLVVDPVIAAVLKREVLHLLGYRLVDHGPDVHLTGVKRFFRAISALGVALVRQATHTIRPKKSRGPGPTPDDPGVWIVRRRLLDLQEARSRGGDPA